MSIIAEAKSIVKVLDGAESFSSQLDIIVRDPHHPQLSYIWRLSEATIFNFFIPDGFEMFVKSNVLVELRKGGKSIRELEFSGSPYLPV